MAHTPLPWAADEGLHNRQADGDIPWAVYAAATDEYADPGELKVIADFLSEEDARLIVRAVNAHEKLLEALQRLVTASEDFASSEPDMPSHKGTETIFDEALVNARAAIAAATE